jgi:antitoxin (DNA-binding transcriptional repressor) of toxin-antitoxin stability system
VRGMQASPRFDKVASRSYFVTMRAVGLKTLKNRLSEYIRLVGTGETVLVTDRDRVVAELTPPRAGRSQLLADAMLADAVRRGWVTPPLLASAGPPPRQPIMSFQALIEELQHDRDDR